MTGKVAAFQFEALPRLPAISVSRSRGIARGLASLTPLREITARGLGRIRVQVDGVEPVPWRSTGNTHPSPETAFLLLRADGSFGSLTVERFFALSLVRSALNAPPPPVVRPLSPSERGVLAAIVAGALAAAGVGETRISFERWRPLADRDRIAINLTARTTSVAGGVTLELPLAWLPSSASALAPDALALVATLVRVELGRTTLDRADQLGAGLGDVVVFEGVSAVADEALWACQLWIGDQRALGELARSGEVRRRGQFMRVNDGSVQDMSNDDNFGNSSGADAVTAEGAALLASAPVEVVAELGRITLRGDEVMGLLGGSVLSLGERRRDLVVLLVGGRAWARGEIVTIDDDIGVRITEILRPR